LESREKICTFVDDLHNKKKPINETSIYFTNNGGKPLHECPDPNLYTTEIMDCRQWQWHVHQSTLLRRVFRPRHHTCGRRLLFGWHNHAHSAWIGHSPLQGSCELGECELLLRPL